MPSFAQSLRTRVERETLEHRSHLEVPSLVTLKFRHTQKRIPFVPYPTTKYGDDATADSAANDGCATYGLGWFAYISGKGMFSSCCRLRIQLYRL